MAAALEIRMQVVLVHSPTLSAAPAAGRFQAARRALTPSVQGLYSTENDTVSNVFGSAFDCK